MLLSVVLRLPKSGIGVLREISRRADWASEGFGGAIGKPQADAEIGAFT